MGCVAVSNVESTARSPTNNTHITQIGTGRRPTLAHTFSMADSALPSVGSVSHILKGVLNDLLMEQPTLNAGSTSGRLPHVEEEMKQVRSIGDESISHEQCAYRMQTLVLRLPSHALHHGPHNASHATCAD